MIGDLNSNGISGTQGDPADIYASMRWGAQDVAMADLLMTQWSNFARTGDPSTASLEWTPYSLANDALMEHGNDGVAAMTTGVAESP